MKKGRWVFFPISVGSIGVVRCYPQTVRPPYVHSSNGFDQRIHIFLLLPHHFEIHPTSAGFLCTATAVQMCNVHRTVHSKGMVESLLDDFSHSLLSQKTNFQKIFLIELFDLRCCCLPPLSFTKLLLLTLASSFKLLQNEWFLGQ